MSNHINIDPSTLPAIKCDCGGEHFLPYTQFRFLSRLQIGAPTDQVVPLVSYACSDCGEPFNPDAAPKPAMSLVTG